MKKILFVLAFLFVAQYLIAAGNDCTTDTDCAQGESCIFLNSVDDGICILDSDLLDGDNIYDVLWSENETENSDKINFFIFYNYSKADLISQLRNLVTAGTQVFTNEDVDVLESKSELELYNIISSNYLNILNLRPWTLYSGMFRFIKVNIKNSSNYNLFNRLSMAYTSSHKQRDVMSHERILKLCLEYGFL